MTGQPPPPTPSRRAPGLSPLSRQGKGKDEGISPTARGYTPQRARQQEMRGRGKAGRTSCIWEETLEDSDRHWGGGGDISRGRRPEDTIQGHSFQHLLGASATLGGMLSRRGGRGWGGRESQEGRGPGRGPEWEKGQERFEKQDPESKAVLGDGWAEGLEALEGAGRLGRAHSPEPSRKPRVP